MAQLDHVRLLPSYFMRLEASDFICSSSMGHTVICVRVIFILTSDIYFG